jgi:hypothetical protein
MHITLNQAVAAAEAVVQERGYMHRNMEKWSGGPPHYFTRGGEGSCLVGAILVKLGIGRGEITRRNFSSIDTLIGKGWITVDCSDTHRFLAVLQNQNDNSVYWGRAVLQAKYVVNWREPTRLTPTKLVATPKKVNTDSWLKRLNPFQPMVEFHQDQVVPGMNDANTQVKKTLTSV